MSSNAGMTRIVQNMGSDLWDSYLRRFKFGVPTRIGMGGEQFGALLTITQYLKSSLHLGKVSVRHKFNFYVVGQALRIKEKCLNLTL